MERIQLAAIIKKSFELNYHAGTIWCEHLDGMGSSETEVIKKFDDDVQYFSRPSVSSYMIINLDNTKLTDHIADTIVDGLLSCSKVLSKIVFVGVPIRWHRRFNVLKNRGILIHYMYDYERAKEWLFL